MRVLSRSRFFWPAAYVALALGFLVLLAGFYHPVYGFTSLFQLDASHEGTMLPALRERPVYVYRNTGGYDGQFYAQFVCSPLLRDPALPRAMDNFGYRARRILASWVAWAIGFGNGARSLDAYALLNPLCWVLLAVVLLAVFPPRSGHDLLAWGGILFSAGTLASVRLALTDLPAFLLVAGAALALQRARPRCAVALIAMSALARETSLVAAPVLKADTLRTNVVRGLVIVAPLLAWYFYVRSVAGPGSDGWSNFTWPGAAFLGKWRYCLGDLGNEKYPVLAWLALLSLLGMTTQAVWLAVRPAWENLWWRLGIGYVGLMLLLGNAPWEGYPGAAARVLLPMQLAFNALVPRTRTGLALLILGNLGVGSGIEMMLNPPHDRHELAATRVHGTAFIARVGDGWFDIEGRGSHTWCWSGGTAELDLFAWHEPVGATARVSFKLQGFTPRHVTIRQAGRVVWTGLLAKRAVPVSLELAGLSPAGIALVFTTDAPPLLENHTALARRLAFSISDFRFDR